MIFQIDSILKDVRVSLDENRASEQLITDGDIDTLSLDEIIRSKIVEAVRRVHSTAPSLYLEEGHEFMQNTSINWNADNSGWIILPDDFMRLVAFCMSDWERTCYSAITAADPLYSLQRSRFRGLRGGVQKPVCAMVNRPEGKVLEFYSCASQSATVKTAMYMPYPEIETKDNQEGIDIAERCYEAVVYTIAALTLAACGDSAKAAAFDNLAKTIFE